jgi:hypothetical protein
VFACLPVSFGAGQDRAPVTLALYCAELAVGKHVLPESCLVDVHGLRWVATGKYVGLAAANQRVEERAASSHPLAESPAAASSDYER